VFTCRNLRGVVGVWSFDHLTWFEKSVRALLNFSQGSALKMCSWWHQSVSSTGNRRLRWSAHVPLAAMQPMGRRWSCFHAGSGGPAGDDFGAWCRDHLSSSGEWQCPWLIISHWGGADAVPVVTSGGHGPSGTQWICWRITRQPVCASGVDTQRRVIFMEDGRGTLSRSLTVIRRRFPQARGWTSAGGLALRLYSETR
jgi:hypothetical protein